MAATRACIAASASGYSVSPSLIRQSGARRSGFFVAYYPSDLAAINMDRTGTTHIGRFLLNHSFMIPGLIGVGGSTTVGYFLSLAFFYSNGRNRLDQHRPSHPRVETSVRHVSHRTMKKPQGSGSESMPPVYDSLLQRRAPCSMTISSGVTATCARKPTSI
jgi:hypothetical protein